jgi:hypothetical protein
MRGKDSFRGILFVSLYSLTDVVDFPPGGKRYTDFVNMGKSYAGALFPPNGGNSIPGQFYGGKVYATNREL